MPGSCGALLSRSFSPAPLWLLKPRVLRANVFGRSALFGMGGIRSYLAPSSSCPVSSSVVPLTGENERQLFVFQRPRFLVGGSTHRGERTSALRLPAAPLPRRWFHPPGRKRTSALRLPEAPLPRRSIHLAGRKRAPALRLQAAPLTRRGSSRPSSRTRSPVHRAPPQTAPPPRPRARRLRPGGGLRGRLRRGDQAHFAPLRLAAARLEEKLLRTGPQPAWPCPHGRPPRDALVHRQVWTHPPAEDKRTALFLV